MAVAGSNARYVERLNGISRCHFMVEKMVEILEYAQVARDKIEDSYLNGSLDIIRILV